MMKQSFAFAGFILQEKHSGGTTGFSQDDGALLSQDGDAVSRKHGLDTLEVEETMSPPKKLCLPSEDEKLSVSRTTDHAGTMFIHTISCLLGAVELSMNNYYNI